MSNDLDKLEGMLIEGQRRSMQGSYSRRNPAPESMPFLLDARSGLKEYVKAHEDEDQAWRLLSQAEECLLNYAAARRCLETAMSLSGRREKKDLKRLALLKEYGSQWATLKLTPVELAELGDHLRAKLTQSRCDHTMRFTQEWLQTSKAGEAKGVIEALFNLGGCCDCEVLSSVVAG